MKRIHSYLSISINDAERAEIDRVATERGVSRSYLLRAALASYLKSDVFTDRQCRRRVSWPTFHQDVLSWAKNERPITDFVREGSSPKAVAVRFHIYARQQGWIVSSRRNDKRVSLASEWLSHGLWATEKQRLQALSIVKNGGNLYQCCRELGLSHQRMHQIIKGIEADLATKVDGFPVPPRKSLSELFSRCADGSVYRLEESSDFKGRPASSVAVAARNWAIKNGYTYQTMRDKADPQAIFVRFVKQPSQTQAHHGQSIQ